MNSRSRFVRVVVSAIAAAAAIAPVHAAPVQAAPGAPQPSDAQFSLSVSPARLVVPAGRLHELQRFTVTNKGTAPVEVVVSKSDFAAGSDGRMELVPTAPYSASTWVAITPASFHLAAHASRAVEVRIDTPATREPGEHQVAVVFMVPAPSQAQGGIKINRGIGAPIYISAPGPVDTTVVVSELTAPRFAFGGPVNLSATVTDTGSVHRDFVGNSRLAANIGDEQVRFEDFTVLRGASRQVSAQWSPPLFCVCRAVVSVHSAGGQVSEKAVTIVVIPIYPALAGLALVATLVAVLLLRSRRRRGGSGVRADSGSVAPGDLRSDIVHS